MNTDQRKNQNVTMTASGIEEIGVTLSPAYPGQSWQELILSNNSDHHIIVAMIIYQVTRSDGKTLRLQHLICHREVYLEKDPAKIKELLKKYPTIPPRSKWLVGLDIENIRLTDSLPAFSEVQAKTDVQNLSLSPLALKSVHASLEGIITEDGQTFGAKKDEIAKVMNDILAESQGVRR